MDPIVNNIHRFQFRSALDNIYISRYVDDAVTTGKHMKSKATLVDTAVDLFSSVGVEINRISLCKFNHFLSSYE